MPNEDAVAFYSARAEEFGDQYRTSRAFRQRFEVWSRLIERYGSKDIDALDVGCGVGTFTFEAARWCRSATGIDASAEMVRKAREAAEVPNVEFQRADIEGISSPPVGLVLCSSVLEYVPDFDAALQVLQGLVAPDGHLIVSMPNPGTAVRTFERALYRVTGRPSYMRHVRNTQSLEELTALLPQLRLVESTEYGRGRGLYAAVFAR
jgi:2-polyprenyl-6-hydroxyphenyl methylase/3-demethylubiquinone-9 3-methyltransferase